MLKAVRFAVSLLISLWGLVMMVLGVAEGQPLWILLGLAVLVVGVPLLASNPLATDRLYPPRPESSGIGA